MSPDGLESTSQVFTSAADLASSSCTEVRITTVFPDEAHPTAWSNVTQLAPSIRVFTLAYALILPFKDALTEMSAIEEARFDLGVRCRRKWLQLNAVSSSFVELDVPICTWSSHIYIAPRMLECQRMRFYV